MRNFNIYLNWPKSKCQELIVTFKFVLIILNFEMDSEIYSEWYILYRRNLCAHLCCKKKWRNKLSVSGLIFGFVFGAISFCVLFPQFDIQCMCKHLIVNNTNSLKFRRDLILCWYNLMIHNDKSGTPFWYRREHF